MVNFVTRNVECLTQDWDKNIIDLRGKSGRILSLIIDNDNLKSVLETTHNNVILIDSIDVLMSKEFLPIYNRSMFSHNLNIIASN